MGHRNSKTQQPSSLATAQVVEDTSNATGKEANEKVPIAAFASTSSMSDEKNGQIGVVTTEEKKRGAHLTEKELFHSGGAWSLDVNEECQVWTREFYESLGCAGTNKWRVELVRIDRTGTLLHKDDEEQTCSVTVAASTERYGPKEQVMQGLPFAMVRKPSDGLVDFADWLVQGTRVLCARWNGEVNGLSLVRRARIVNAAAKRNGQAVVDLCYDEGDKEKLEFDVPIDQVGIDPISYKSELKFNKNWEK